MTVRDAERLVKSILDPNPKFIVQPNHEVLALSQQISDALGAKVKLKQGKDGKGSVEIFFMTMMSLASWSIDYAKYQIIDHQTLKLAGQWSRRSLSWH